MFHTHTTELTIMPPTKGPFMTVEVGPNTRWTSVAILLVFTSRLVDVSFGKAFFKTLPVYNTSRHKSAYLNFRKITRCRGICSVSCRSHHHARLQGFKDDGPSIEAISAGLSLIEAIVPPTKPRRKSSSFETPGSIKTETVFSIFLFMYYARH